MRRTAKQVSEAEFKKQYAKYQSEYAFFMKTTRGDAWAPMLRAGRGLIQMIMGSVGIPSRLNKKFEAASKAILGTRSTRNVVKWQARNAKHLALLADSINWPFLSEDEEEQGLRRFPLADFTVHNILGLSEPELLPLKILIAKAFHQLRRSKVKGIREMLYGDVHLVGKLARSALAWYNIANDTIYLRPVTGSKKDALHSLMHEIGHRFWRKAATPAQRNAWLAHHKAVGRSAPDPWDVSYPSVGDEISIAKERGRGRNRRKPTVMKIVGTPGQGAMYYTESGGYFTDDQFQSIAATNARWGRFPTNYAATDPVEHFCEALSMYAAGSLKEEAANSFNNVFGGGSVKMGNDKSLRAQLVRLAHQKPELRAALLPLLASKTAGSSYHKLLEYLEGLEGSVRDLPRFVKGLLEFFSNGTWDESIKADAEMDQLETVYMGEAHSVTAPSEYEPAGDSEDFEYPEEMDMDFTIHIPWKDFAKALGPIVGGVTNLRDFQKALDEALKDKKLRILLLELMLAGLEETDWQDKLPDVKGYEDAFADEWEKQAHESLDSPNGGVESFKVTGSNVKDSTSHGFLAYSLRLTFGEPFLKDPDY